MFWSDISYLNAGSERQRDAYLALIELDIFSILAEYDPVLTGTFPLGLEGPASDLDIICYVGDLDRFQALLVSVYGGMEEFSVRRREKNGLPTVICAFRYHNLPVEIFGQDRRVEEQNAYRHLVAEAALLRAAGDDAKQALAYLRDEGLKTEPAFAHYFRLEGDPYVALLALADATTDEIDEIVEQGRVLRRNSPPLAQPLGVFP
jgi:hypothetical protein